MMAVSVSLGCFSSSSTLLGAPLPRLGRLRLRPLPAPVQSLLLHLLAHPLRRFLRVWQRGRVLQRRHARRGGPRSVPRRRRLRRVLPGAVQGQGALQHGRRRGHGHGQRQDEPYGARAKQPGLRRHGRPARQARRGRRRVQEGAVRVRAQEPFGEGGGEEPRAQRPGHQVLLPGRPDRHRRRRHRAGRVVELEVHGAGARAGVEHEPGAGGAAAAQGCRDRRVQREMAVGRKGSAAEHVARRRSVRHRAPDHRHRPGSLLSVRHAGLEVKKRPMSGNTERPQRPSER